MRDQHLVAERLRIARDDDFRGEAGQIAVVAAVGRGERQRHQPGTAWLNLEPELPRQFVSERGRADFRNGEPAGGDHQGGRAKSGGVGFDGKAGGFPNLAYLHVRKDFNVRPFAFFEKHGDNLARGSVAEELPFMFFVIRNAVLFDEGNEIGRRVAGKC